MASSYFNWSYYKVQSWYNGMWGDKEINAMFRDLFGTNMGDKPNEPLVEKLDAFMEGEIEEEEYKEAIKKFKQKWITRTDKQRKEYYAELLEKYYEELKEELLNV